MSPQPTIWSKPGYLGEKTIGNHCNSIRGYQGIRDTRVSGISGRGMRKPLKTIAISGGTRVSGVPDVSGLLLCIPTSLCLIMAHIQIVSFNAKCTMFDI